MSLDLGEVDFGLPADSSQSDDDDGATTGPYRTNVQGLSERLASRFTDQGFTHPAVAALAVTVRGLTGLAQREFAAELDLSEAELDGIESGTVDFDALPSTLTERIAGAGLTI